MAIVTTHVRGGARSPSGPDSGSETPAPTAAGSKNRPHLDPSERQPKDLFVPRKKLSHDVPAWVPDGSLYFVTIHCLQRATAQLTVPSVAEGVLESVAYYHRTGRWFARLFLLMPDHAHGLVAFPSGESMRRVVSDWKRYTARRDGIRWQRDFFEHRIRPGENWDMKSTYIRENPVRAGLIVTPMQWPWYMEARPDGTLQLGGARSPSGPGKQNEIRHDFRPVRRTGPTWV
jgi:REP element-mobilizing transposase RayT